MLAAFSRDHLSFSYFFSFLELSTLSTCTFLYTCLSCNTLDEHINLRVGMLPVTDIELADLAMPTVDNERVLAVVGVEVIIVDGVDGFHFGVGSNYCDLIISEAQLLKEL